MQCFGRSYTKKHPCSFVVGCICYVWQFYPRPRAGGELRASGRPGERRRALRPAGDLRSPSFRLARRVSHGVVPLPNSLGSKARELSFALFLYHLLGNELPAGNAPMDHLFLTGLNKSFP